MVWVKIILLLIFGALLESCLQRKTSEVEANLETTTYQQPAQKSESQLRISQSSIDKIITANLTSESLIIVNQDLAEKIAHNPNFKLHSTEESLNFVQEGTGHWIFATAEEPSRYGLTDLSEIKDWDWDKIAIITAAVAGSAIAGGLLYRKFSGDSPIIVKKQTLEGHEKINKSKLKQTFDGHDNINKSKLKNSQKKSDIITVTPQAAEITVIPTKSIESKNFSLNTKQLGIVPNSKKVLIISDLKREINSENLIVVQKIKTSKGTYVQGENTRNVNVNKQKQYAIDYGLPQGQWYIKNKRISKKLESAGFKKIKDPDKEGFAVYAAPTGWKKTTKGNDTVITNVEGENAVIQTYIPRNFGQRTLRSEWVLD